MERKEFCFSAVVTKIVQSEEAEETAITLSAVGELGDIRSVLYLGWMWSFRFFLRTPDTFLSINQ